MITIIFGIITGCILAICGFKLSDWQLWVLTIWIVCSTWGVIPLKNYFIFIRSKK